MKFNSNIKDTALIIEGGGMRSSYTSGITTVLIEKQLYFNFVAGISAGSTLGVNYIARNIERTKKSFVDMAADPKIGGIKSFLKGNGYFNSEYLYGDVCFQGKFLELNYEDFMNSEADLMVGAFNAISGELKYFSKKDMYPETRLAQIVRASSSMPILMPITEIENELFYDGGIAGGIPIDIAKEHGYDKFFIILTRPKGYRKSPPKFTNFLRKTFKKYPKIVDALIKRSEIYNRTLDEIEELEKSGKAFVVYSEDIDIENTELNISKLEENFLKGYNQANRDVEKYKEFVKK